jgi:hypothetical protein
MSTAVNVLAEQLAEARSLAALKALDNTKTAFEDAHKLR